MYADVGLRIFPVISYAERVWLVGLTGVVKFAMMVNARLVVKKASISANVGRLRWKGIVARRILGAIIRATSYLGVGSMHVPGVVMRVSVGSVHFRGRGLVLVGRECMKEWLVMLLCHSAGALVISC